MGMVVSSPQLAARIRHYTKNWDLRFSAGILLDGYEAQAVIPEQAFTGADPEIAIDSLRDRVDIPAWKAPRCVPDVMAVAGRDSARDRAQGCAGQ